MTAAFGPVHTVGVALSVPRRAALCVLLQAWDYAEDCQRDAWDFSVEIGNLRQYGLTSSDLRWLVCKGFATYGTENTRPADKKRSFHPEASLAFTDKTCFMLTATGLAVARRMGQDGRRADPPPAGGSPQQGVKILRPLVPRWDRERRELRWAEQLVKRYRIPAPNQEVILAAFEEEGWPPGIDDPLPQQQDQDPKQRLHDTIKSLNRHQVRHLLVFTGDGTGEGVQWRHLDPLAPGVPA